MAGQEYRTLRPDKIIETSRRLQERIAKRFPGSGLSAVAVELEQVAEAAAVRGEHIRRPNLLLRSVVALMLVGACVIVVIVAQLLRTREDFWDITSFVQTVDAALESIVFIGLAILFLVTLEIRIKRRRALAAIHELRAIAHVVDMHQLSKDPEKLLRGGPAAPGSPPQTTTTSFQLNRYLNYCNELLAIISKIAALYVQNFPDTSAVSAVDDIESLCSGLSQRIWQKIMVMEEILDGPPPVEPDATPAFVPVARPNNPK